MNKKKSQQTQQQLSQSNGGKQGVSETFLSPPVEEALHEILRDWPQLVPSIEQIERNETDYNPITLALELLDTTNPASKSPDMFFESLGKLEHAMEVLVDEYYTPFNASIQTYSQVSQMVGSSLTSATTIKSDLVKCITLLSERRNDRMNQELLSVWTKSVKVKEMLKMFTQIDELVQTPAKLQRLMTEAEYVQAAKLLLSSLKKLGVGQSQTSGLNEVQGLKQLTENLLVLRKELPSQILDHLVEIMFGHGDYYYQQNLFSLGRQLCIENSGGYGIDGDIHHPGKENDNFIPGHIRHNRDQSNSVQSKSNGKVSNNASTTRNDSNKDVFHLVNMCVQALDLLDKVNESAAEIKSRLSNEMFKVTEAVIKQFECDFGQTKGQLKQFKKKTATLVLNEVFNLKKKDPLWTLLKGEDEQQRKLLLLLFSQLFERYKWIYQMNQYVVKCLKDSYMSESTEKMYYLQVTDGRKSPVKDKVLRLSAVDSWNAIQTELKDILGLYLDIQSHQFQDKPLPIAKPQGASGNASNSAVQKSIFQIATESITGVAQSAKSASSPLKSKPEDGQLRPQSTQIPVAINTLGAQGHKVLVDGSIANILTLYKPCVDFAAFMEANFLNRFERRSEIFSFLNTALGTHFIEYINKMVVESRYNTNVMVDDAFDIDSESDDYYLVQRCFPSMSALLYDVYVVQRRMLMFADKLQAIIDRCMNQFISSCSAYFEKTAGRINSGLSSEYSSSRIAIDVLQMDQVTAVYRQVFTGGDDGGNSGALNNVVNHDKMELSIDEMHSIKQRFIEQRFGEEFAFINVDYSSVESIANLYVSLRWFTRSIECISVKLSNIPSQTASPSVQR